MLYPALVYLITCHAGPAAHFAAFAKELTQRGYQVEILATGPALKSLEPFALRDFNPNNLDLNDSASQEKLAIKIAESLKPEAILMTDVGHPFMAKIQEQVAKRSPHIHRLAYYDNPEAYVPGYSQTAAKVMATAEKVLFANANLATEELYISPGSPLSLPQEKRLPIGYYPLESASNLQKARKQQQREIRKQFLERHHMQETGQKILVYFGSNSEAYFNQALPAFLRILQEAHLKASQYLILLQQHPGAKEQNIDGKMAKGMPLIISDLRSEEVQVLSDAALYYQTSMGPQFAIAGIPTIQIGHEIYPDILVRNKIAPSITTTDAFKSALQELDTQKQTDEKKLFDDLGVMKNWADQLETALVK